MKYLLQIVIIFCVQMIATYADAQYLKLVTDPGLNGQLKRMVDQQWNDWQPDPTWKFFGTIPRDPTGALMWGVLNRSYWKGADKRPYQPGGEFQQNIAALSMEKQQTARTADSVQKMMEQELATYANMLGGAGDVAYSLYFKNKFEDLFQEFTDAFEEVHRYSPSAFSEMQQKAVFKNLQEQYQIHHDRIATIHQSFMEKGARMEAYFNILKEVHLLVDKAKSYCSLFIHTDQKYQLALKKKQYELSPKDSVLNNDQQIVQEILIKTKF